MNNQTMLAKPITHTNKADIPNTAYPNASFPYEFAGESNTTSKLFLVHEQTEGQARSAKALISELKGTLDNDTLDLLKNLIKDKPEAFISRDSQGVTLIDRLGDIAKNSVSSELIQGLEMNRKQIQSVLIKNILEKVATQGCSEQADKATCTACSAEIKFFEQNPAEFARVASEWAHKGRAILQSGVAMDLNIRDVIACQNEGSAKYPGRNLVDLMFQESFCKWMSELKEWGGHSYRSKDGDHTTTWTDYNGQRQSGFYAQQQQLLDQALSGVSSTLVFSESEGPEFVTQQIRHALRQPEGKGGILVFLNWDIKGGHTQHAVTLTEIFEVNGKSYVRLKNGHHGLTNGPERVLEKMDGEVFGKTEILSLEQFQKLVIHAAIPDSANNQKSLLSTTSDPVGSHYDFPIIDGVRILNASASSNLEEKKQESLQTETTPSFAGKGLSHQVNAERLESEDKGPEYKNAILARQYFVDLLERRFINIPAPQPRNHIGPDDFAAQPPKPKAAKNEEPRNIYFSKVREQA